jgi:hypothetical protein
MRVCVHAFMHVMHACMHMSECVCEPARHLRMNLGRVPFRVRFYSMKMLFQKKCVSACVRVVVCVCVCVCVCVLCARVCMFACMLAFMYERVGVGVCMHACVPVYARAAARVCMFARARACGCEST